MGNHGQRMNSKDRLTPMAGTMLAAPLRFIHEVHLREREICASIDMIAQGSAVSGRVIKEVITFLETDLPLHLSDEEEDLFPLMRRRCDPEDEIEKVIARLRKDHLHADEDTQKIVSLLEELLETPRDLAIDEKEALSAFASHSRRHLILENAIILPFARLRLTELDLETLYVHMCKRRGIESLTEKRYAKGPA